LPIPHLSVFLLALVQPLAPSADTFLNSAVPDNNDGTSPSMFTGENGQGGLMRGLLRFSLPPGLQGRATVTRVTLTMTTRGTGQGDTTAPTAATESLQAVTIPWTEGSGFGDGTQMNTVGQPCGTTGATWNQPDCAGGTPWSGGAVAAAASGTTLVPAASETAVTWDSDAAGNAGMVADVQSWLDAPAGNHGWRIASSTEGTTGQAQRFYTREVPDKGPTLSVTIACKAGFSEVDGGCTVPAADAGTPADASQPAMSGGGGCSCSFADRRRPGGDLAALVGGLLLLALARAARPARSRPGPRPAWPGRRRAAPEQPPAAPGPGTSPRRAADRA